VVATNRADRYRGLDVETVSDAFPGCGPLAGIHAAMRAARHPHVFVAACDMPGLDADVIRFLLARIGDADAIVPRWDHDLEPLHAVYAVRLVDRIEEALRNGHYAIRELLPRVRVDYVAEDELRGIRGTARSMLNVNTPEELAAVGGSLEDA
jgi:molybdopterin-guanine dinucleotide biosynthesis protein A